MAETGTNPPQQNQQNTQAQQPQVQQPTIPVEQAKPAAEQLKGGLKQGMEQLKQTGIAGMLKPAASQPKVTTEEKLWAGISYIPLVALAALVIKPDSGYVKLHGRQGLIIFLIFFFCIFVYLVPYIGPLFGGLIQFGLFITGLFSMYQAFIGNWWKIPVLGDLSEMIPIDMFAKVTKEVVTGQPVPQEPETAAPAEALKQQPPVMPQEPEAAAPAEALKQQPPVMPQGPESGASAEVPPQAPPSPPEQPVSPEEGK